MYDEAVRPFGVGLIAVLGGCLSVPDPGGAGVDGGGDDDGGESEGGERAHWTMDWVGTGLALGDEVDEVDDTLGLHRAVCSACPTAYDNGGPGGALRFGDGPAQVSNPGGLGLAEGTISLWLAAIDEGAGSEVGTIIARTRDGDITWALSINAKHGLSLQLGNEGASTSTIAELAEPDGTFVQIAATWTAAGVANLYVDGAPVAIDAELAPPDLSDDGAEVWIGATGNGGGGTVDALVAVFDDLRLHDEVLDQLAIKDLDRD